MRPSRKVRNDLAEDYRRALGKINDAGSILEDASISISALGQGFDWESCQVISELNTLYTRVQSMRSKILEVETDD